MLAFFKGLGVGFLCLLLFIAGVIFNVEFLGKEPSSKLHFVRDVEVSNALKADFLRADVSFWAKDALALKINLSNEEKTQITSTFNEILNRFKEENFCSNGSLSIEPSFSYENGVSSPKGQRLRANFECEFKEDRLNSFNKLLEDVNLIVEKSEFIGVSVPALEAKFSKTILDENKEKLYSDLLKKAYSYEKTYSLDLNKTCILQDIKVGEGFELSNQARMYSVKSANLDLQVPIIKEKEQSLNAKALFICK